MADELQWLALFKVKVFGFLFLLNWFCFERRNPGGNIVRIYSDRGRFRSEWREFVPNLLSVFGANLDEGMNRANCHVEPDTLVKDANDVANTWNPCAATGESVRGEFRVWSEVVSAGWNPAEKEGSGP